MLFGNPVRQKLIRPPGSPTLAGSFRVTHDFGPSTVSAEPKVIWPGGEGIAKGTYARFHQGIDLGNAKCGADLIAMAAGTVAFAQIDSSGSLTVIIDHGGGWRTWYAHMASRSVSKGQKVAKGQKVGTIGSSGNSTACHDHCAVEWANFPGTVVAIRGTSRSYRKFIDAWRRLEQNVRVRPDQDVAAAIRIRSALTLDLSTIFAESKNGRIIRVADNVDLGPASEWRDWDGDVAGPSYPGQDGTDSTAWSRILLDGAYRFVARGYAELSQT